MTPAQVLRDAASLMVAGRSRKVLQSLRGKSPLLPMQSVMDGHHAAHQEAIAAMAAVAGGRSIFAWATHPDRTMQDVIDAMRAAADALDGGAS